MTAEVRDTSVLPPPEPKDQPDTRPPLDLVHMLNQVRGVQTVVAVENERVRKAKGEK